MNVIDISLLTSILNMKKSICLNNQITYDLALSSSTLRARKKMSSAVKIPVDSIVTM